MFEILTVIFWVLSFILAVLWVFLPWIIISKLDEIINELRKISTASSHK